MSDELILKWGTLKGWDFSNNEKAKELLKEYVSLGMMMGCASQRDTPRQKEIILELIDICDNPEGILLDWEGEMVSKEKAKQ